MIIHVIISIDHFHPSLFGKKRNGSKSDNNKAVTVDGEDENFRH